MGTIPESTAGGIIWISRSLHVQSTSVVPLVLSKLFTGIHSSYTSQVETKSLKGLLRRDFFYYKLMVRCVGYYVAKFSELCF